MTRGVYPGSFNPPTRAHLAISEAARDQLALDEVVWAVSRRALAKDPAVGPPLDVRLQILESIADEHEWLAVVVTERQLLADIAEGFDALIMGADKWLQIHDVVFYDNDPAQRDAAIARLPQVAIAPRKGIDLPTELMLDVAEWVAEQSSTGARAGRIDWMLPTAADHDARTGAWTAR